MFSNYFKAPLNAAFFCAGLIGLGALSACSQDTQPPFTAAQACSPPTNSIAAVQGTGFESPIEGELVTLNGVVTLTDVDEGFFIEQINADEDDNSSNGIFVLPADHRQDIQQGTLISVEGTVAELEKGRYSLTALTDITQIQLCSDGQAMPLTSITGNVASPVFGKLSSR